MLVAPSRTAAQCSRFQIGTVSFSVSMQNRAAANASAPVRRRDDDATDASESSSVADAVQQHEALDVGPPLACVRGDLLHARDSAGSS